uniref:Ion transport domain-containing protein n=1 Tax=Varanus komodoensis TaxID=61221 RepID=A0A8D2KWD3_VARKO
MASKDSPQQKTLANFIVAGELSLPLSLLYFSFRNYFRSNLNVLDCIIVVGTLLINIVYTFSDLKCFLPISLSTPIIAVFRILRVIILIRVFRLASEKKRLEKVTRRMVSQKMTHL